MQAISNPFILLVEDDLDLRETLTDLLISEKYHVETATDGRDALEKLKKFEQPPKVIILDWMMPRMDGPSFLAERKKSLSLSAIPVILLSADGRVDSKADETGATEGISKPVDVEVLLAAVRKYV